jgi:two-component system chemotaxis sensor kinase CheA
MRHLPAASELPIIALSAMVSNEAIERGRAVGFHDFVAKFDRAGLIAAIKEQSADVNEAA